MEMELESEIYKVGEVWSSLAIERQMAWGERNPAPRRFLIGDTELGRWLGSKCSPTLLLAPLDRAQWYMA